MVARRRAVATTPSDGERAEAFHSGLRTRVPVGLEAAALQPRIDAAGAVRPQLGVCLHQRVDFERGEFPPLPDQGGKRPLRKTSEFEPEFLVGDETSYDSFNSSL